MKQAAAYLRDFDLVGEANPKVHIPISREIEATIYNSFKEYCQESVVSGSWLVEALVVRERLIYQNALDQQKPHG